jgi:hypothetical protein
MKTIEVIRESDNKLQRIVWDFWFDDRDAELVLSNYSIQFRKTKRHKYVIETWYSRIQSGRNSLGRIPADKVPVPTDVVWDAKKQFFDMLSVVVWPERKD